MRNVSENRSTDLEVGPSPPLAPDRPVPALVRGGRILDAVMLSKRALTVSDLARQLKLPKSSVHGVCATLTWLGLLARRPGNTFAIGPHVMRWANAFLAQTDLTAEFSALWDTQSVLTDETITLSVMEGQEVIYIACRNSAAPPGVTFRIGMRLPAAFTATGKAILSTMPDHQVKKLFRGSWPEPMTKYGVRNIEDLLVELVECRCRGYSIDNGQIHEGMYCFGAPVRDSSNLVVSGVAVSLLAARVDEATTELAGKCVRAIADELSVRLGANLKDWRETK